MSANLFWIVTMRKFSCCMVTMTTFCTAYFLLVHVMTVRWKTATRWQDERWRASIFILYFWTLNHLGPLWDGTGWNLLCLWSSGVCLCCFHHSVSDGLRVTEWLMYNVDCAPCSVQRSLRSVNSEIISLFAASKWMDLRRGYDNWWDPCRFSGRLELQQFIGLFQYHQNAIYVLFGSHDEANDHLSLIHGLCSNEIANNRCTTISDQRH